MESVSVGRGDQKHLRVLGRIITINDQGVIYEPDQRHAEAVCRELRVSGGNSCATPWEKEAGTSGDAARSRARRLAPGSGGADDEEEAEEKLKDAELTTYRSLSARLNYLALDRPDIQ